MRFGALISAAVASKPFEPWFAKMLGVRPEYLSAPAFRNRREFACALLENKDIFGYMMRNIDGTAAIATGYGPAWLLCRVHPRLGRYAKKSLIFTRLQKMNTKSGNASGTTARGAKPTMARAHIQGSSFTQDEE